MVRHGLTGSKEYENARRRDWKHKNREKIAAIAKKKYSENEMFKQRLLRLQRESYARKKRDLKTLKELGAKKPADLVV